MSEGNINRPRDYRSSDKVWEAFANIEEYMNNTVSFGNYQMTTTEAMSVAVVLSYLAYRVNDLEAKYQKLLTLYHYPDKLARQQTAGDESEAV